MLNSFKIKILTLITNSRRYGVFAVADPGFPVGGVDPLGGRGPPTQALFGENACENERIGSRRGVCARHAPWIHQ